MPPNGQKHTAESREKMRVAVLARWAKDPRRVPLRECLVCGTSFTPSRSKRQPGGQLFCSRPCWQKERCLGPRHHQWNPTGRRIDRSSGAEYFIIRTPSGRWRAEHSYIAERTLGRSLKPGEVVHHINGNGLDNRNSNLLICTQSYHAALHSRMALAWMREHMKGA